MAEATDGGIVVSRTVNDLAFGSHIEFTDLSERELRGVPGSWALFAVADGSRPLPASAGPYPKEHPGDVG
jgi:class 3 adenylate cyclase